MTPMPLIVIRRISDVVEFRSTCFSVNEGGGDSMSGSPSTVGERSLRISEAFHLQRVQWTCVLLLDSGK